MSTEQSKTASANPAFGSALADLETLIAQGSKAAQEDVSTLPGAEHDTATPETAKGDYPLEPDPVADATDATVEPSDDDVVQPAVTSGEPEETVAGEASSETPAAETDMVTSNENEGAGKQANELLASIQTAAQKLAADQVATDKVAQETPGNTAPPAEAPNSTDAGVTTAEAAPAAEDEKLAETIELTNDVLSKIGALVMDDVAGQKLAVELIQRQAGKKAASDAMQVLGGLHASLEQQAIEKQAAEDADQMVEVLSKEAAEYGMDLQTYLNTLEAGRQKLAAAQSPDGAQKVASAKQKVAQELEALSAPPAAPAVPPEAALAGAIEGAGDLPAEPELSEEDALMIALQEMIESGELTEEDLAMLAAQAEGAPAEGAPAEEPAPEGEDALAAMAAGEDLASEEAPAEEPVPEAAAADAAEDVIPEEDAPEGEDKEAADKLISRILRNLTGASAE